MADSSSILRRCSWWVYPLAFLALALLAMPLDGLVGRWTDGIRLGGDVRRTLETLQQFGDLGTLMLTGVFIWLLDPPTRRRLLDMALACGMAALACLMAKCLIGRPRPELESPWTFVLPWQTFELLKEHGQSVAVHAWKSSRLWSMPSSHTAAAVAMSLVLVRFYPKLKPLGIGMSILVGLARVLLHAHYPSDVLVGAALGWMVAYPLVKHYVGVRLLDWLWVRLVDRKASAAYPKMVRRELLK